MENKSENRAFSINPFNFDTHPLRSAIITTVVIVGTFVGGAKGVSAQEQGGLNINSVSVLGQKIVGGTEDLLSNLGKTYNPNVLLRDAKDGIEMDFHNAIGTPLSDE